MNIEPKIEIRSDEDTIGQFIVEPLEQGMGNTLGNALRRLLLSGIEGAAVTSICIHKKDPSDKECPYVEHEFKPIPGVKEDVTDLMLNLRNMYVKLADNVESGVIKIDVQGKGEVTGDRTECSEGVEVVNKDETVKLYRKYQKEYSNDLIFERNDYDEYVKNRGLNNIYRDLPVDIARNNEDLFKIIQDFDDNKQKEMWKEFFEKYKCYNDGHASEKAVDWILSKIWERIDKNA